MEPRHSHTRIREDGGQGGAITGENEVDGNELQDLERINRTKIPGDIDRECHESDCTMTTEAGSCPAESSTIEKEKSNSLHREPGKRETGSGRESQAIQADGYQGGQDAGRVLTIDGEAYEDDGYLYTKEGDVIWVDFAPQSFRDPLFFPLWRKWCITAIAICFTLFTSWNLSAFAIGQQSMIRDLQGTSLQGAAGLGLYAWGFAIFPLFLAPFSEEFGRRGMYIASTILYWLCFWPVVEAKSFGLLLPFRFLSGGFGSVGSTLVGGSLADIWTTSERGSKMGLFALCAVLGTSLAPVPMSWVEMNTKLEWRWIQYIQIIVVGAYLPVVPLLMPETRSAILLRRQASKLRKERGIQKGRWTARAEVGKLKFTLLMKISLIRPLNFLVTEPVVLFMSLWISLGWGVLYGEVESIPYVFDLLYNFSIGHIGLVYLSLSIGTILGFFFNIFQEYMYKRNVERRGPEARLYAALVGGIAFTVGCFIYAWTTYSQVTYIAPTIGIAVMVFGIFSIYLSVFNYLADSYLTYASSALAGQSFLRNMVAGCFPFFTTQMYENLKPHYASTLFGCLAGLLAVVPFVAFIWGPQLRARSKMSRKLLEEEEMLKKLREEQKEKLTGNHGHGGRPYHDSAMYTYRDLTQQDSGVAAATPQKQC